MNKILTKTLCAFILLASQQLFAQVGEKVVPVEQEPRHRVVFHNNNVRIYDALILPGDNTLFHTHSFDNVFVVVSGGKGINETPGTPPLQIAPVTGAAGFIRGTKNPYTHRIGNVGTTPLRLVVAEVLTSAKSAGVAATLEAVPGHTLVLENELVKVYRVSLDPKKSTGVRSRTLPWLRISVSDGMIAVNEKGKSPETLQTKAGDFRWHEGATAQTLENVGLTPYEAIEIEWKSTAPPERTAP